MAIIRWSGSIIFNTTIAIRSNYLCFHLMIMEESIIQVNFYCGKLRRLERMGFRFCLL